MQIRARIRRLREDGGAVRATLTMRYGEMMITGLRLVQLPDGRIRLVFPDRKQGGKYVNVCYPMTEALMNEMEKEALIEYEKAKEGKGL